MLRIQPSMRILVCARTAWRAANESTMSVTLSSPLAPSRPAPSRTAQCTQPGASRRRLRDQSADERRADKIGSAAEKRTNCRRRPQRSRAWSPPPSPAAPFRALPHHPPFPTGSDPPLSPPLPSTLVYGYQRAPGCVRVWVSHIRDIRIYVYPHIRMCPGSPCIRIYIYLSRTYIYTYMWNTHTPMSHTYVHV